MKIVIEKNEKMMYCEDIYVKREPNKIEYKIIIKKGKKSIEE